MWFIIAFFLLHWYGSLFFQSFFLHRYAAHGMFTMSKGWEKFFYYLTYFSMGSSYLTPRAYAVLHRLHHAHSDTDKDPHSPHNSTNPFMMMWKTKDYYVKVYHRIFKTDVEFEKSFPEREKLDNFAEGYFSRISWGVLYTAIYVAAYFIWDFHWAFFFLLPIHWLMGPIQGAIVNWSGHKYGYQNFDNNDKSKNTLIFDFICIGELFQNNHHKLPLRPRFGVKWFEFDPTYAVMSVMNKLGIIQMAKA
ncbi:MAG TPA: acyl-CoA desaturase [Bacteroidia bacterium]